jgi:hypothetical protein
LSNGYVGNTAEQAMNNSNETSGAGLSAPQTVDVFPLNWRAKVNLWVQAAYPLAFLGVTIWAVTAGGLSLTAWGPLILLGLTALAAWNIYSLIRWHNFQVVLSEAGIKVGKRYSRWEDIASAHAQTAAMFKTFIELTPKDGAPLAIPAAIEQAQFILAVCEKNVPALIRKG